MHTIQDYKFITVNIIHELHGVFARFFFLEMWGNCFCGERKCEKHPQNEQNLLLFGEGGDVSPPEGPQKITWLHCNSSLAGPGNEATGTPLFKILDPPLNWITKQKSNYNPPPSPSPREWTLVVLFEKKKYQFAFVCCSFENNNRMLNKIILDFIALSHWHWLYRLLVWQYIVGFMKG